MQLLDRQDLSKGRFCCGLQGWLIHVLEHMQSAGSHCVRSGAGRPLSVCSDGRLFPLRGFVECSAVWRSRLVLEVCGARLQTPHALPQRSAANVGPPSVRRGWGPLLFRLAEERECPALRAVNVGWSVQAWERGSLLPSG